MGQTIPPPVLAATKILGLDRKFKQLQEALASNLIITDYRAKNLKALLKVQESGMG